MGRGTAAANLPTVRGHEVIRALERDGWYVHRTTGHTIMRHPSRSGTVPVPNHPSKPVAKGTLRHILSTAGLSPERFRELL